jgi:pimeloyl-ACP methyl ester carboxylesterase
VTDQIDPLDPELLDLVEAEKSVPPPSPEQVARLYARTVSSLGLTAGAIVTKFTLAALVVGLGVGSAVTAGVMANREPQIVERVVVVPGPPPPPIVIEKEKEVEKEVIVEKKVPAVAKKDDLRAEQALIERARSALAKRDGAGARVALEEHRAKFANGKLSEERDALHVVALAVEQRKDEAKLEASAFEAKYPKSLFLAAVRAAVK